MKSYDAEAKWRLWQWTERLSDHSQYVVRLTIVEVPWFALCMHFLLRADTWQYAHNHPKWFLSIILRGGYTELRNGVERQRNHFNFFRGTPNDTHIITAVKPNTVTLCFMGPKTTEWGFKTRSGWYTWYDFAKLLREKKLF